VPSYRARDFIAAIPGSAGIISTIAQHVGCAWHTAKKWTDDSPTVRAAYLDECEKVTDMAEGVVLRSIKKGDVHTAKWYLTMKGRERGYAKTERREVGGLDGEVLKAYVTISPDDWSDGDDTDNGDV